MRCLLPALAMLLAGGAHAASLSGELRLEGRWFAQDALDPDQHATNLSLSVTPEFVTDWDAGRQSLVIKPFARVDRNDGQRTHVDLREAVWIRYGDGWEVRAGVDKVFWGVTEVHHLVDVVNQTDLVENPDGEQKLGQPMLKGSLEADHGVLDLYLLPYFRERTFPGAGGRLRTHPRVADELARYANSSAERHLDLALRWTRTLGYWDVAAAWFRGLDRAPRLVPGTDGSGAAVLIPEYGTVDRLSLDAQGAIGEWLWKFEGLWQTGHNGEYLAATGGFEYTHVGVAGTFADLGLLCELMWDERGRGATTPFNNDLFAGVRLAFNDAPGTEVLTGMVVDWRNGGRFFNLEASRRLGSGWKVAVQARAWFDIPAGDPLFSVRQDDYIEAQLIRYF